MLTWPNAGELKCLGPLHKTASKEINPAQASIVDAHSVGTGRGTTVPFRSYHKSLGWCRTSDRAWCERWFHPAAVALPPFPIAAVSAVKQGGSLAPKMYRPLNRGVPSGRLGRTAICSAARSFGSFRFLTSRKERMRTEYEGSLMISWTSSAVTERPSKISVDTSRRICCRRRAPNIPRRGPE